MNRFHSHIQVVIGNLGDHVARMQRIIRVLADARQMSDEDIGPDQEKHLAYLVRKGAKLTGKTIEEMVLDERPGPADHNDPYIE